MCQACVDDGALRQETYDQMLAFLNVWPEAEYGPAHIVLGDQNIHDGHLIWCIGLCKAALSRNVEDLEDPTQDIGLMDELQWYATHAPAELQATLAFLQTLLAIPQSQR